MNAVITRYLALPLFSAGVLGAAALGLAGAANAAQGPSTPVHNSSVAAPQVHAAPAPEAQPGGLWHRHHTTLIDPMTAADLPNHG